MYNAPERRSGTDRGCPGVLIIRENVVFQWQILKPYQAMIRAVLHRLLICGMLRIARNFNGSADLRKYRI